MWPDNDIATPSIVLEEAERIPLYTQHLTSFRTCVQAGGNCGVYAQKLAAIFASVITCEPDPLNFECLRQNVTASNAVFKFGALGNSQGYVKTFREDFESSNFGATKVKQSCSGSPILRVDDLGLLALDFLFLDVEGWEYPALLGAADTIKRCKPLISVEMKQLGKANGWPDQMIHGWICAQGYSLVDRIGRDRVYKHS